MGLNNFFNFKKANGTEERALSYAEDLRTTNPQKMEAMDLQVRNYIEHAKSTGLLQHGESLNEEEVRRISNYVMNAVRREQGDGVDAPSEDQINKVIEGALLTGVAERLSLKAKGMTSQG